MLCIGTEIASKTVVRRLLLQRSAREEWHLCCCARKLSTTTTASGSGGRRVVVTGMGAITPLGKDLPSTWAALMAGHSGARLLPAASCKGNAQKGATTSSTTTAAAATSGGGGGAAAASTTAVNSTSTTVTDDDATAAQFATESAIIIETKGLYDALPVQIAATVRREGELPPSTIAMTTAAAASALAAKSSVPETNTETTTTTRTTTTTATTTAATTTTAGTTSTTAAANHPVPKAAQAELFSADDWNADGSFRAVTPDCFAFAVGAAAEAVQASGWSARTDQEQERAGVSFGSSLPGLADFEAACIGLLSSPRGARRVSPYVVPHMLTNMAAGFISMAHGLRGPNHCASTACASGAHAIGDAFRFIKYGDADVMVCGGADGGIHPAIMAGFCRIRALATGYEHAPTAASRPFSVDRSGFVIGEGSGALVLEEREHALARGAPILAEVLGYGLAGDAAHMTAPDPGGRGAAACMKAALRDAGLSPCDIDHINAHATSTPLGDAVEAQAIKSVFGDHAISGRLAVSATKGATGHLLGAAGAVEACFGVLSIQHGQVPPTLNLHEVDPGLEELDYTPLVPGYKPVNVCMSNSFGFGGTNACLVFGTHS